MIRLTFEAPVATAVLDRPPVNAIDRAFVEDLDRVLAQVESRDDVSVLLVRSACKAFCAGADISLMREMVDTDDGRDAMVGLVRDLQRVLFRLEDCGVVTLAEIGGAALGGGLELALACDLRICGESARLGLPEAALGLLPGAGGTQRLPRVCGDAVARRLILGAEVIDGAEAARLGLVHRAVPDDRLAGEARQLAGAVAAQPAQALAACKRCIGASRDGSPGGFEMELAETRRLYGLAESRERIRAFLERRGKAG